MVAVLLISGALYVFADHFVSPATFNQLVQYEKIIVTFAVGLWLGGE